MQTGSKEREIEDRKDKRIKMQGSQQSELIQQRQTEGLPKNFESSGNDVSRWIRNRSSLALAKSNNYLIILYYVRSKTRRGF